MARLRAIAVLSVLGLALPLVSHVLAASDGTVAWLIDLAAHWQWVFVALLVISTALASVLDRRWAVLLLTVPLPWVTASGPAPMGDGSGPVFSVATANVLLTNSDARPLMRWLARTRPDVVVLLEASPEYVDALAALEGYPFREAIVRRDPFSMVLLARHPLLDAKPVRDADGIGRLEATVQWRGSIVDVVALHPAPPLSPHYHAARNRMLRLIAEQSLASGRPTVVAGDLNATPWSSAFSGLAARGLRRASGLRPSWPADLRGVLGVPIDHVLVSPQWARLGNTVGPDIGSDHFPVVVGLVLRSMVDQ